MSKYYLLNSLGQWNAVCRWYRRMPRGLRTPSELFWLSMAFVSLRAKTFLIKWQRRVAGIRYDPCPQNVGGVVGWLATCPVGLRSGRITINCYGWTFNDQLAAAAAAAASFLYCCTVATWWAFEKKGAC